MALVVLALVNTMFIRSMSGADQIPPALFIPSSSLSIGQEIRQAVDRSESISVSPEFMAQAGMTLTGAVGLYQKSTAPLPADLTSEVSAAKPKAPEGHITQQLINLGGFQPPAETRVPPVKFTVELIQKSKAAVLLWEAVIEDLSPRTRPSWREWQADLTPFAGKQVQLRLTKSGDGDLSRGAWAIPQVRSNQTKIERLFILISLDTLRADHLGTYGYSRPTSPWLDWLSRTSLLFTSVFTVSPWTLPAHASMLTGTNLPDHRVKDARNSALPVSLTTLAEQLQQRGFATGAFTGGGFVGPGWDLERGFELMNFVGGGAGEVFQRGLNWLDERSGKDVFLFLHTYEVHAPYAEYAVNRVFAQSLPPGQSIHPQSIEDAPLALDAYDDSIRNADAAVGEFISQLQQRNVWEKCVLLITSDHGEEFLEHGALAHGAQLHTEVMSVPIILRVPGQQPRIDDRQRSIIDIFPTFSALAGVAPGPAIKGRDLLAADSPSHSDETHIKGIKIGVRHQGIRALLVPNGRAYLYDLTADPGELYPLTEPYSDNGQAALTTLAQATARTLDNGQLWFACPPDTDSFSAEISINSGQLPALDPFFARIADDMMNDSDRAAITIIPQPGVPWCGVNLGDAAVTVKNLRRNGELLSGRVTHVGQTAAHHEQVWELAAIAPDEKARVTDEWSGSAAVLIPPVGSDEPEQTELPDDVREQLEHLGYIN